MDTIRRGTQMMRVIELVAPAFILLAVVVPLQGASLAPATLTMAAKDVRLLSPAGGSRSVARAEAISNGAAIQTGPQSRAELTFTDRTLARLGGNSVFSVNDGPRALDLKTGAVLLRVPPSAGKAVIDCAGVSTGASGATVIVEKYQNAYVKLLVLEGTARVYIKNRVGESLLMHPGQLMFLGPQPTRLASLVDFDLERLVQTSQLIKDFPPLADRSRLLAAIAQQKQAKKNGTLIDTHLVIFGRGTLVSLTTPDSPNAKAQGSATHSRTGSP